MTTTQDAPGTGGIADTTTIATRPASDPAPASRAARPDLEDTQVTLAQRVLVGVFVGVPMLALLAAIPFAWGWGLGWHDIVIGGYEAWRAAGLPTARPDQRTVEIAPGASPAF